MQYSLTRSTTRIGREQDNDIVIGSDEKVSRHHAEIRREPDGHVVYDLNSRNGTFVNGRRVNRQRLASGDVIRIGRSQITFQNHMLVLGSGMSTSLQPPTGWGEHIAPAPHPVRTQNTTLWAALAVALLVVFVIGGTLLAMNRPSDSDSGDRIARSWVAANTPLITEEIAARIAPAIPLEYSVLLDKVREQVTNPQVWAYAPPVKVAEGVYRVEPQTAFGIALTTPPTSYGVNAVYLLTIDTDAGLVVQAVLQEASARAQ